MVRDLSAAMMAAALVAVGAAAGCGTGKNSGSSGSSASTVRPDSAPASVAADLRHRLLTPDDLSRGFVAGTAADSTMSSSDPDCGPVTDLMNSRGRLGGAVASAAVSFTRSAFGPTIDAGLSGFESSEAAQGRLAEVADAMGACSEVTETDDDGSSYDFLVTALPSPSAGDAGDSIRMTVVAGGVSAQVDLVLIRHGSTLLYVTDTGFGRADPHLTERVVARAVAKLADPADPADVARTGPER